MMSVSQSINASAANASAGLEDMNILLVLALVGGYCSCLITIMRMNDNYGRWEEEEEEEELGERGD